ncbi:gnat family protein [Fusarium heterosporum]|uniref:Gnat family protein n=1 Tax=Fusarium heterosporum TaxID=42747 RepID=A0A8H5TQY0_FUSHE|nr:gnat family protein [Fusarium heterosporum]
MSYKTIVLPKSLSDPLQWDQLVEKFKTFRLQSLQLSPESFSSTYAREINFTQDIWESRLKSTSAITAVIIWDPIPSSADYIPLILNAPWIASLILSGPLNAVTAAKDWEEQQNFDPGTTYFGAVGPEIERGYVLNAIYVLPSERRKGLANQLIEYAKLHAVEVNKGKKIMLVLLVNFESFAARKCYEKSGFEMVHDYWFSEPDGSGSKGHAAVMRLDVG